MKKICGVLEVGSYSTSSATVLADGRARPNPPRRLDKYSKLKLLIPNSPILPLVLLLGGGEAADAGVGILSRWSFGRDGKRVLCRKDVL